MTKLLSKAFERLSELSTERQDDIAQRLLTDLPENGPPEGQQRPDAEALAEACRQGWLTPPQIVSGDPPPRRPVAPLDQLLDELSADRDGR